MFNVSMNRLASWIALVAIIFSALAPTISHAFPIKTSASFQQEVCDVQGAKRLLSVDFTAEKKSVPTQNQATTHFEHCLYCASHMTHVGAIKAPLISFLSQLNAVSRIDIYTAPLVQAYYPVTHPSHAPPLV